MTAPLSCHFARERISASMDGELAPSQEQRLAEHLAECGDCARHKLVLARGSRSLQDGLAPAPEALEWKVQLGIQRALRQQAAERETAALEPPRRRWLPVAASAAAAAVLVLAVGLQLIPSTGPGGASSPALPQLGDARPVSLPATGAPGWGLRPVSESLPEYRARSGGNRVGFEGDLPRDTMVFQIQDDYESRLEQVAQELYQQLLATRQQLQQANRTIEDLRRDGAGGQDAPAATGTGDGPR